jgi:DNA-binding GntR family transcriptional regulator
VKKTALVRIAEDVARAGARSDFPRYRQIIDALVRAIEHGILSPGDRLPPEIELAALFSVSPGTIQKALAHLADSGFVQRSRRRGTFVAGRPAEDVFVFRFKNPATGKILIPFTRVLSLTEDASEGPWRKVLDVERCVRVERLVWVEGDSPAFSQFHISIEHGRHLLDEPIENLHGVSFHRILGKKFNLPTLRTTHRLQCRKLCPAACRHLIVPEGTFGTVWDVVGFSHQRATTYQSLQIPAGHRPIELDAAMIAPRAAHGAERIAGDQPRNGAANTRELLRV